MNKESKFTKNLRLLFQHTRKENGDEYTPEDIQVATRDALTASYVWRLKKGLSDNPTYKKIEALANFFGVAPGIFFQDEIDVEALPTKTSLLNQRIAMRTRALGDDEIKALQDILDIVIQTRESNLE